MTAMEVLQDNLDGEQLLWSEKARPLASLRLQTIVFLILQLVIFSVIFSNFHKANAIYSTHISMGWFMNVFVMAWTIFLSWEVVRASFSVYGITNQRLMIVTKYPWYKVVVSYYSADIDFIKKGRNFFGGGNLVWKTIQVRNGKGYSNRDIGFFGINNVDSVERLIVQTFRHGNTWAKTGQFFT